MALKHENILERYLDFMLGREVLDTHEAYVSLHYWDL